MSAGIGEEILVVAAPVTVLRFYRVSGRFAVPVLVAARMAYHLYYGHAGVWWLAPWALATAIVYWRWPDVRLLVALMVLDVVWNAQGVLFGDDLLTDLVLIGVGLALLAVAFAIDLRWYRNPTPPMTPTTSLRTVWLRAHGTPPELAGASAEALRRDPLAAAHLWWGALATRDRHPRALADLTVDPSCWDFDAVEQELSELSPAHELVPTDTLDGTAGVDLVRSAGGREHSTARRLILQRGADRNWRVRAIEPVSDGIDPVSDQAGD